MSNLIISVPVSDIFALPDRNSEHSDEAFLGTKVEVSDKLFGFCKIKTYYGYTGWVEEKNISEELHEPNCIVTSNFCDLLKNERNFHCPSVTLPMGAYLDIGYSHEFPDFGFAVLPDKRTFFVRKSHFSEIPKNLSESDARKTIVSSAESFLGTPYRWGGRTHMGIDCSGLTFTSYQMAGITIWRDADYTKTEKLKKITPNEMKPGDLLFFPGHTALYLGNKKFIHASGKVNHVIISSLDEKESNYSKWCSENITFIGTVFGK